MTPSLLNNLVTLRAFRRPLFPNPVSCPGLYLTFLTARQFYFLFLFCILFCFCPILLTALLFDNQGVLTNKVHIIILYFLGLKKSLQCTSVYQLTWLQWSYCQICVKVRVAFRQTRQSIKMFQVNKIRRFQVLVSLIN